MRARDPDATVTVWAEDEHRLGLLPVARRVWAPCGQRPTAAVQRRYQWRYVDGFVRPTTGQRWWGLLPTATTVAMQLALTTFAREEGIDAQHPAVLVLDGAGWHTSPKLTVPDGLPLVALPPASPDLQPAERLWPLVTEPVANRSFADLDALEAVLVQRCRTRRANRDVVRALTHYGWWPSEPPHSIPD